MKHRRRVSVRTYSLLRPDLAVSGYPPPPPPPPPTHSGASLPTYFGRKFRSMRAHRYFRNQEQQQRRYSSCSSGGSVRSSTGKGQSFGSYSSLLLRFPCDEGVETGLGFLPGRASYWDSSWANEPRSSCQGLSGCSGQTRVYHGDSV